MDARRIGHAGLVGWREKVGERGAELLARKTPLRRDTARAILGLAFLAVALRTAVRMVNRMVQDAPQANARS